MTVRHCAYSMSDACQKIDDPLVTCMFVAGHPDACLPISKQVLAEAQAVELNRQARQAHDAAALARGVDLCEACGAAFDAIPAPDHEAVVKQRHRMREALAAIVRACGDPRAFFCDPNAVIERIREIAHRALDEGA